MKTKLTIRERKFIDAYVKNGGNATQAYIKISPNCKYESARVLGCRWLTKVNISVIELADEMGLTDPVIIQKLIDGLNATKEMGKGIHSKEITDYGVIAKYIDMSLKLKDKYPSEKHDVNVKGELKVTDARQKLIDEVNRLATRAEEDKDTK